MDILKTPQERSRPRWQRFMVLGLIAFAVILAWQLSMPSNLHKVERSGLLLGEVRQGDIAVQVEGYGNLRSNRQKLLTALTSGTVEEIVLKPGALVAEDSVILRLSNPDVRQEVVAAEQALAQQRANIRQLDINQQRELLAEEDRLEEIRTQYETARLNLDAQKQLADRGVVSALAYQEIRLQVSQLEKRIGIMQDRTRRLEMAHREATSIEQERLKQQEGLLQVARHRLASLEVTAGMSGILQRLPVDLGQGVVAGEQLALIGGTEDLVALIRIPQTQADQVEIGQGAVVDTRSHEIDGRVARVDPAVEEGTVTVEINLLGELPDNLRPELNVDGTIYTDTLDDTLYIERPVNARVDAVATMFQLTPEQDEANAIEVHFGSEAGRHIQILGGAAPGDILILSDMSRLADQPAVTITD